MSGFFGIFNRNGKPVDKEIVNTMLDAASYWDPDERDVWTDGQVALGHTMLWNTPESKYEHLPLEKEATILTMDARIDNRDELFSELELPNRPLSEVGDSEFILAAYQKWGEECPKYLLGDFAFSIWDEQKQKLFCARDHVGIKSFYYYLSDDIFIFSNDIETILSNSTVPQKLDDVTVATFLKSEGIFTKRDTFFHEIKKLPSASTLCISALEEKEEFYWAIENSPKIHFETYDGYVDKLKELYNQAVEARLRTDYKVTSHMSGGIDSSPIAVLTSRKLKKRNQKLHTFNWIEIPDNDEKYEYEAWSFSRQIAQEEDNIIHEEFSLDENYWIELYQKHNVFTKGTMYYWEEYYVQDRVKELGARTLLSGWGGDELISHNSFTYLEGLLKQKKYSLLLKYIWNEHEYSFFSPKKYTKSILKQILPYWLINVIKRDKKSEEFYTDYEKYIVPQFRDFFRQHKVKNFNNLAGVRERHFMLYYFGHIQERVDSWALASFSKKFEYRYPLLDKRIIEFAVGIPEELFYPKNGKSRHLIKNSVKDLLPDIICWSDKPNEAKVNNTYYQRYIRDIKQIQSKNIDIFKCAQNDYIDCEKIENTMCSFDFKKSDISKLLISESLIIFMESLKKLRYN